MSKEKSMEDMKARHKKEIDEFQNECRHGNISEWMTEQWAPGHSSGYRIKVCNICNKIVDRDPKNKYYLYNEIVEVL